MADPPIGSFSFRRVTRDDFALLATWLAEPHVARYWNHEFTPEAVERDFGPTADGDEPFEDHLALLEGEPVGLVQFGRYVDDDHWQTEMKPVYPVSAGDVSIDYLIGDPARVGKGVGRAMIRAFVDEIWRTHSDARSIVVPVVASNEASWRMLLGAGFRLVARGELEPDNPIDGPMHEILRFDRPSSVDG